MPETQVVVGGCAPLRASGLPVWFSGSQQTFRIGTDRLSRQLVQRIDALLLDLLEIAATVFVADSSVRRGGRVRADFGKDWRRTFRFQIPVRRIEFWNQRDVQVALVQAVHFLADDDVTFEFFPSAAPEPPQAYLPFSAEKQEAFTAEDVILFSGGLDSLAGALERLETGPGRVVLVSHRSAPKVASRQEQLVDALRLRHGNRILWIPVTATRVGQEARDTTQRSRSFLYAVLGFIAARMVGATRVRFFENGVVSANLPISPQVIGTMATRTTHPLALRSFNELLALLPGKPAGIENSYIGLTKTEVVEKLRSQRVLELIPVTMSCTNVYQRSDEHSHCGECSQCLDRRFALLAAGLAAHDPAGSYETEVMTGARPGDRSRTMAADWPRHAASFRQMSEIDFSRRFEGELTRLLAAEPDSAAGQRRFAWLDIHRRQAGHVGEALEAAIKEASPAMARHELPPTCLLKMHVTGRGAPPAEAPVAVFAPQPAMPELPAQASATDVLPLQLVVGGTPPRPTVTVLNLAEFDGSIARLIVRLKTDFDRAVAASLVRAKHPYVGIDLLVDSLNLEGEHVRKLIQRCRDELRAAYVLIEGRRPASHLLIQTSSRRGGYRLDPTIRFVNPEAG